jgi:hypothetical protein
MTAVHLVLALPWLLGALALVLLGIGDPGSSGVFAAIPLAVSGVAVWLARGGRLIIVSLVAGVVGFVAVLAVLINYVDHVPESEPARSIADGADYGLLYLGVAVAAAIVVGIIEWRSARASARAA